MQKEKAVRSGADPPPAQHLSPNPQNPPAPAPTPRTAKGAAEAHGGHLEFVGNDSGAVVGLVLPAELRHS